MDEKIFVESKKKSKLPFVIAAVVMLLIFTVGSIYISASAPTRKLNKQLTVARQYLNDADYENAILEFAKALEIDEMCVDAYLGMADAYIAQAKGYEEGGDIDAAYAAYKNAIDVLTRGYELTGDQSIKSKLDECMEEYGRAERIITERDEKIRYEEWLTAPVEIECGPDTFKYFGYSVMDGNRAQNIIDENGIALVESPAEVEWEKYYAWFDDRLSIYAAYITGDAREWDGRAWMETYTAEDSGYVRIVNDSTCAYPNENFEGPIKVGDTKEHVEEMLHLEEFKQKGNQIIDDDGDDKDGYYGIAQTNYGECYFNDSLIINIGGRNYHLSFEKSSVDICFDEAGTVTAIIISKWE